MGHNLRFSDVFLMISQFEKCSLALNNFCVNITHFFFLHTDGINEMDKVVLTSVNMLQFIPHSELLDSDERYLKNDQLILGIEVKVTFSLVVVNFLSVFLFCCI